jgi:hypothetical protein
MLNKQQYDRINIGAVMVGITGPGQFPSVAGSSTVGRVYEKQADKWGYHLIIKTTDGRILSAESAHNPNEHKGCGWYLVENEEIMPDDTEFNTIYDHKYIAVLTIP